MADKSDKELEKESVYNDEPEFDPSNPTAYHVEVTGGTGSYELEPDKPKKKEPKKEKKKKVITYGEYILDDGTVIELRYEDGVLDSKSKEKLNKAKNANFEYQTMKQKYGGYSPVSASDFYNGGAEFKTRVSAFEEVRNTEMKAYEQKLNKAIVNLDYDDDNEF